MSTQARILYVDDSQIDRALVRNALTAEHEGFELVEAATVEAFESALHAGAWDAVLADINILGYSGLDIVDTVQRHRPGLPVIIVTGTGSEEIAIGALRRGVDDYVIKSPAHILRLPQTIQAALDRRRLRDEKAQADAEVRRLNIELEQRVLERTGQLQEAMADLEAFSASVAHDLRAPLRAIDGYSAILQQKYADRLDAAGQDNLARVREAAREMAALIEALLDLSRLSRAEMRQVPVDLSALAGRSLERLRQAEPERRVQVNIQTGLVAHGDVTLLGAALDNLLSNAWKFTARAEHARIDFGVQDDTDERVYFVRDNGAGFEPDLADRLFTPFRRLHRQEDFPGLGIGLATVRRIVRRHGGRIWAESAAGQGATFFFTLG